MGKYQQSLSKRVLCTRAASKMAVSKGGIKRAMPIKIFMRAGSLLGTRCVRMRAHCLMFPNFTAHVSTFVYSYYNDSIVGRAFEIEFMCGTQM